MGIPSLLPYSFSTILMSWKTKTQNENQKKKEGSTATLLQWPNV
jgi:hypothetical protein